MMAKLLQQPIFSMEAHRSGAPATFRAAVPCTGPVAAGGPSIPSATTKLYTATAWRCWLDAMAAHLRDTGQRPLIIFFDGTNHFEGLTWRMRGGDSDWKTPKKKKRHPRLRAQANMDDFVVRGALEVAASLSSLVGPAPTAGSRQSSQTAISADPAADEAPSSLPRQHVQRSADQTGSTAVPADTLRGMPVPPPAQTTMSVKRTETTEFMPGADLPLLTHREEARLATELATLTDAFFHDLASQRSCTDHEARVYTRERLIFQLVDDRQPEDSHDKPSSAASGSEYAPSS